MRIFTSHKRLEHAARPRRAYSGCCRPPGRRSPGLPRSDFGELPQLVADILQTRGVVNRQRDADLGGRHHVHRRFVAVEHLEDPPQKAVRHQHARGLHVDNGDLALAGDRFDDVGAGHGFGHDSRASDLGPPRIQNQHRNVLLDGGQARWPGAAPWRRNRPARRLRRTRSSSRDGRRGRVFGSTVSMPSTSVQIWISSAPMPAPTSEAVKSDPPRPSVVVTPSSRGADEPAHDDYPVFGERRNGRAKRA